MKIAFHCLSKTSQCRGGLSRVWEHSELENMADRRDGESKDDRLETLFKADCLQTTKKGDSLFCLECQNHKINLSTERSSCIWTVWNLGRKDFFWKWDKLHIVSRSHQLFHHSPPTSTNYTHIKTEISYIFWFEGWMDRGPVIPDSIKCYKHLTSSEGNQRKNNIQGL